jgi:hypothetical protein
MRNLYNKKNRGWIWMEGCRTGRNTLLPPERPKNWIKEWLGLKWRKLN